MIRGIGLRGAVAVNVITMIGIGPLITIPLVLAQLAGSLALVGWIAGALVALCDGLVWAELGSQFPGSGGTYVYLRETFGRERWGRFLAFLFNWQFMLYAPFLLASGYIGFSNYARYFIPGASSATVSLIAIAVGVVTIAALFRPITNIARFGQALGVASIGTLVLIIVAAAPHVNLHQAFALPSGAAFGTGFLAGLGGALYVTLYDYVGYNDAALLGDEVREPHRTIPIAIVVSIVLVACLYIALQVAVLGTTPWHLIAAHDGVTPAAGQYVASTVVERSWGRAGGFAITVLVLVTAFASVYGNLLGFSRIPFAAARDGVFFAPFARLHPKSRFPYVSLLVIGGLSLVASLFTLDFVIAVLTAGIVLIQSVAQIAALFVLRARGKSPGFRMWLFPLPAIVALGGWIYAFFSTGVQPILLGTGWLCIGAVAYVFVSKAKRLWPFAAMLLIAGAIATPAHAESWNASSAVRRGGTPVFTVNGKPFFVYGAAFFYERMPRGEWSRALDSYKRLGINTIDLYVPWNWHELSDGDFDFTGRTNPQRDLRGLLRLIHARGYKLILRPGPMIRNEWRNGGYPAWLLERPEYDMPLHDILEGRYAATATLQNAHSDDAANEWMHNKTHMRYAARWLRTVLHVVEPQASDVIAIALDDDQGAYIDNQTWPAPHFQAYLNSLRNIVQSVAGNRVPLFINTYQMKVTASAPVWAWGNWYQSDAYSIGEHDRSQLEFSTGLLQTQQDLPVMVSEFQAGWLQNADEAHPRPADPSNTTLALHTMLQMGAHGVVNFPVQDTFNPPGWEAPWANAFYAWDAAYKADAVHANARYEPTAAFGAMLQRFGDALAQSAPETHVAIAWIPSAYAAYANNAQIAEAATWVQRQQRRCRDLRVTCAIADLRYQSERALRKYDVILALPRETLSTPVKRKLDRLRHAGVAILPRLDSESAARFALPYKDAAVLADRDERHVFLDIVNYGDRAVRYGPTTLHTQTRAFDVPAFVVERRSARLLSLDRPEIAPNPPLTPQAGPAAPAQTGNGLVLRAAGTTLTIAPEAGARSFLFTRGHGSAFSTVGAFRDDVSLPPAISKRDYIGKYTHPIPAGTFNRPYAVKRLADGAISLTYDAPDVPAGGARFDRIVRIDRALEAYDVDERVDFHTNDAAQRHVMRTSFAESWQTVTIDAANAYGFWDSQTHDLAIVAWPPGDVVARSEELHPGNYIVSLTFARGGRRRSVYALHSANTAAAARSEVERFARAVERGQGRRDSGANRR